MVKHSKFKNTGILFELLVKQIASDTLSGKDPKSLKIINECFSSNTELNKELMLYRTLLTDKFTNNSKAERFLDIVLEQRKKLDNSKLRKEKYDLVKKINEAYSLNDFLQSRISNYKALASIYKLFEHVIGKTISPKELVDSRFSLLEHVSNNKIIKKDVESKVLLEYEKMDKDVRLLAYKMLLEKFNKKYINLDIKQKTILKEYINNIGDTSNLKEYIKKEVPIIKKKIDNHLSTCDDQVVKIKLTEVKNQLGNYLKCNVIKEDHILMLMRYYQLIKELNQVQNGK